MTPPDAITKGLRTANPWDVPPIPDVGDATADITYLSVGRALSAWEEFESKLALVFAAAVGIGDEFSYPAERAYGSIATFRGRLDMVREALDACDVAACWVPPPPDLKVESTKLFNEAAAYAARRNEVAHGTVTTYTTNIGHGFVLGPASYNSRKMTPDDYGGDCPSYLYTAAEIDFFAQCFNSLEPRAEYLSELIRQWLSSSRKRAMQPIPP